MTMATTRGDRPTFAQWLGMAAQLTRPDDDPVGWLARQWKQLEGASRPKVSAPSGIARVLKQLSPDERWQEGMAEAVTAAINAYRAGVQAQSLADHQGSHAERQAIQDADDLAGQLMAPVPPTSSEQGWALPGGVSAADATYLASQLDQLQAQLGIVMQMLAVSNPLAAQLLLDHVGAEDASAAEGPGAGQLTDAQQVAASIAQANGWVPADQPPTPSAAPAGGFEAWWGVAEPEPDAGSPPQSHG